MLDRFRPGWLVTSLSLIAFCVLLMLGTWQWQRLAWKTELIDEIQSGLELPAIDLAELGSIPYRSVLASGRILAEPVLLQGSYARASQPGSNLTSIFEDAQGLFWLLDRGWIPQEAVSDAQAGFFSLDGNQYIEAVTRPLKRFGPFTPESDFKTGRIFAEDVSEIAQTFGIEVKPLVLVLTNGLPAGPPWDGLPQASKPQADLPNNHLGYVVTWYGLAAALLGVYIAFGLSRGKGNAKA